MDLQSLTLFNMANKKMDWLAQRQAVLAQNIANTDTPDYMPQDVVGLDFSRELEKSNGASLTVTNEKHINSTGNYRVSAVKTNEKHIEGTNSASGTSRVKEIKRPYEVSIDKNGVVLEEQMAKLGRNQHEYEVSTTIYNKYTSMLRLALGKGR